MVESTIDIKYLGSFLPDGTLDTIGRLITGGTGEEEYLVEEYDPSTGEWTEVEYNSELAKAVYEMNDFWQPINNEDAELFMLRSLSQAG